MEAMLRCAVGGDVAGLRQLLASGADVNMPVNDAGDTSLIVAVRAGQDRVVSFLLSSTTADELTSQELDVNEQNDNEESALTTALALKNAKMVNLLLRRGAAARYEDIVTLLESFCSWNSELLQNVLNHQPHAIRRPKYVSGRAIAGTNTCRSRRSPLHAAVFCSDVKSVKVLLDDPFNVDPNDTCGFVSAGLPTLQCAWPIAEAVAVKSAPIVSLLMQHGARVVPNPVGCDVTSCQRRGALCLPLAEALQTSSFDVAAALVRAGAELAYEEFLPSDNITDRDDVLVDEILRRCRQNTLFSVMFSSVLGTGSASHCEFVRLILKVCGCSEGWSGVAPPGFSSLIPHDRAPPHKCVLDSAKETWPHLFGCFCVVLGDIATTVPRLGGIYSSPNCVLPGDTCCDPDADEDGVVGLSCSSGGDDVVGLRRISADENALWLCAIWLAPTSAEVEAEIVKVIDREGHI